MIKMGASSCDIFFASRTTLRIKLLCACRVLKLSWSPFLKATICWPKRLSDFKFITAPARISWPVSSGTITGRISATKRLVWISNLRVCASTSSPSSQRWKLKPLTKPCSDCPTMASLDIANTSNAASLITVTFALISIAIRPSGKVFNKVDSSLCSRSEGIKAVVLTSSTPAIRRIFAISSWNFSKFTVGKETYIRLKLGSTSIPRKSSW